MRFPASSIGGDPVYLRALQSKKIGRGAVLQLSTIFTLLLAYVFLRERLGLQQLFGIGLIVAGALTASGNGGPCCSGFNLRLLFLMACATSSWRCRPFSSNISRSRTVFGHYIYGPSGQVFLELHRLIPDITGNS